MVLALAAVYRFAPCRRRPKWRWVSLGAVAALALWLAGSAGFSAYVTRFASYEETFGVLGTVMLLMTWFYLSAFAVLLGAELNAEVERQTARHDRGPGQGTRPARRQDGRHRRRGGKAAGLPGTVRRTGQCRGDRPQRRSPPPGRIGPGAGYGRRDRPSRARSVRVG
jgi:hypothetical protein